MSNVENIIASVTAAIESLKGEPVSLNRNRAMSGLDSSLNMLQRLIQPSASEPAGASQPTVKYTATPPRASAAASTMQDMFTSQENTLTGMV